MEKNGMITGIWGGPSWVSLHSIAHGYPIDPDAYDSEKGFPIGTTRSNYRTYFTMLGEVLPCKYCRNSYKMFILENPIKLDSRMDLARWLWEIHNKVNKKLGKVYPESEISFENVYKRYESYRAQCPPKSDANGCINPAGNLPKRKCVIIIQDVHMSKCKICSIVFIILATILFLRILMMKNT